MTPLAVLSREVVTLLEARRFETAKRLLETVFASGEAPPLLLVAYGVVLSELGDHVRAKAVAELIETIDDPLLERAGVRAQARAWLPGGALSKAKRDALQSEAEKWLPRGKRGEG